MSSATSVTVPRDLIVELAAYVDRGHTSRWDRGCRPRVPDDCEDYCESCEILRHVADDVLAHARALNRKEGYER